MAVIHVFSIRDIKANVFTKPFFAPNDGVAERLFKNEVNRQAFDNQLYTNPEDFHLFNIGTFDEDTGLMTSQLPQFIRSGDQVQYAFTGE